MLVSGGRLSRLAYVSEASTALSRDDMVKLANVARRNNRRLGVTGMLLHLDGRFFHVLEGPRVAVESVFTRGRVDPRNRWATALLREKPFFRAFDTWSVGCFGLPFDELPRDLFFRADWDTVRQRAKIDRRLGFHRFLERFYAVNVGAGGAPKGGSIG